MDSISSNIISSKPLNDNQLHVTRTQIALRNILPLAKGFNAQGDIFNFLVCEAFYSLGFDKPTFNLQEVGHEIDIVLEHRTEKKIALVESKATKDPIGGDAVNKFVGALMLEIPKYTEKGYQVVAYYVSRSGFKATAIRQEEIRRSANPSFELILLTPDMLVEELVHGKTICSADAAAASVQVTKDATISQCRFADLIACHLGWVWAVYFSNTASTVPTHFTLVHSDGSVLSYDFAKQHFSYIIEAPLFKGLSYFDSNVENPKERDLFAVKKLYYNYLRNELGEITFEGLPADNEAGVIRVKLENIYVPLRFDTLRSKEPSVNTKTSVSSGHMVLSSQRAAVLAKPGGGKTTLIRRIALSYADPKTRDAIDDNMDKPQWAEVIPMAAFLLGKKSRPIIEALVQKSEKETVPSVEKLEANTGNHSAILLANCLALEVPMRDDSLRRCVRTIINNQASLESAFLFPSLETFNEEPEFQDVFDVVLHSKFGTRFQEIAKDLLINDSETIPFLLSYSKAIASFQSLQNPLESDEKREKSNINNIDSSLIELCLGVNYPQFYIKKVSDEGGELGTIILEHLLSPNQKESLLSCLILCAVDPNQIFGVEFNPENYENRRSENYLDSVSSLVDALLQIWIRGSKYPNVVSTVNGTICLYLISFLHEIQTDAKKYKATDKTVFTAPKRPAFDSFILSPMIGAPGSMGFSSDTEFVVALNALRRNPHTKMQYLEIINDQSEQYYPEAVRSKLFKLGENVQNELGQPLGDYLETRYSNPIVETDCNASTLFGLWYHVWDKEKCRRKIGELFPSRPQADGLARIVSLSLSSRYWGSLPPVILSLDDIENKSLNHLMDYFNDRWRNNRSILFDYIAKHSAKDSEGSIRVVNRPHALEIIEEFEKKQHSDDGEKNPKYKILSNSSKNY